jgi:hypothetical protein
MFKMIQTNSINHGSELFVMYKTNGINIILFPENIIIKKYYSLNSQNLFLIFFKLYFNNSQELITLEELKKQNLWSFLCTFATC